MCCHVHTKTSIAAIILRLFPLFRPLSYPLINLSLPVPVPCLCLSLCRLPCSCLTAMLDDMEGGSGGYVAVQAHGGPGSHSSSDNGTYSARGSHSYGAHPKDKTRKLEVPLWRIAVRIAPVAFAIFLSVGTSMLVFPFFTFMHSTGLLGARLPQVSG